MGKGGKTLREPNIYMSLAMVCMVLVISLLHQMDFPTEVVSGASGLILTWLQ